MKKRKKLMPKIMAGIALFAIIVGIVGTGALVIISSISSSNQEISEEELQQIMDSFSGTTQVSTEEIETPVEEDETDIEEGE